MATTVTKTIGSGGDYSTIQAWEDACPADLTAVDQIWRGEVKNQSFTNSGNNVLTVDGITTDATRYVELTTEAGASFVDNGSLATNALRYNTSNGAAISSSNGYSFNSPIIVNSSIHIRISKLQVKATGNGGWAISGSSNAIIDRCILEGTQRGVNLISNSRVSNSVIALTASSGLFDIAELVTGASLYNCTLVSLGATIANALSGNYGTPTVRNCIIMGCTAVKTGGSTPTYTTCLTDAASPPSGCTTTAYSTSSGIQFENITSGSHDFRIKSGSSAINAGTTDSTYAATSINGLSRPQGAAYDVGAWEFASASAAKGAHHFYRAMAHTTR